MTDESTTQEPGFAGTEGSRGAAEPVLFLVKGDASPEEVAALVAVLQATAAANPARPAQEPWPEWSAHHRKVRASYPSGPGGWRSSAMPR